MLEMNVINKNSNKGKIILLMGPVFAGKSTELIRLYNIYKRISEDITVVTCDLTKISLENELIVDGLPVLNAPILGALSIALESISLETIKQAIRDHIKGEKGLLNAKVAEISSKNSKIRRGGNK